jgi:hypothetical protein
MESRDTITLCNCQTIAIRLGGLVSERRVHFEKVKDMEVAGYDRGYHLIT